jgi:predicted transcriptional regulator
MSTTELEKLVEEVLQQNEAALQEAEGAATHLKEAVEESDRRVGPAVRKLQEAGLVKK